VRSRVARRRFGVKKKKKRKEIIERRNKKERTTTSRGGSSFVDPGETARSSVENTRVHSRALEKEFVRSFVRGGDAAERGDRRADAEADGGRTSITTAFVFEPPRASSRVVFFFRRRLRRLRLRRRRRRRGRQVRVSRAAGKQKNRNKKQGGDER
jgi:hypothetical protein